MEKRLNAALANALDGDIMNHLMGKDFAISTDLMPQELAPNAPKAGRRKSNSVEPPDRNSGGMSSRSCGSDGASESELMSSLIRRLTEAVGLQHLHSAPCTIACTPGLISAWFVRRNVKSKC